LSAVADAGPPLRGESAIRWDTSIISAAIVSVVGVIVLGMMGRPAEDGRGASRPVAAGRFDAPAPAVAVIDGDTLEINGVTIRLAYIDAPELGQSCDAEGHLTACGREAAFTLRKLIDIAEEKPDCTPVAGTGAFTCRVGPADPAEVLLASGMATALPDAPAYYREAERRARAVPLGIWKGSFVTPGEWRLGKRLPAETAACGRPLPARIGRGGSPACRSCPSHFPSRPCVIKGVVSATAGHWYFGPLDPGYASIDAGGGHGRTFCSVDEARGAGWPHGHLALGQQPAAHN